MAEQREREAQTAARLAADRRAHRLKVFSAGVTSLLCLIAEWSAIVSFGQESLRQHPRAVAIASCGAVVGILVGPTLVYWRRWELWGLFMTAVIALLSLL